jgi:hypothetical protein
MNLHEHTYASDGTRSVCMIAKACRDLYGGKKLTHVHISPKRIEQFDGYAMQTTHSGDPCLRLYFSKPYTANQTRAMYSEIRELAKTKLHTFPQTAEVINVAFVTTLQALTKIGL